MASISERENQLIAEFDKLKNWEERYRLIIEKGKSLAALPDLKKTEEAKVKGCQSQVWLHAKLSPQGLIEFEGDSDALLVKGLVAILISVYNLTSPSEILGSNADFLKRLGFESNLSPSRSNGLFSMLKQIRYYAVAFQFIQKN